MNQLSFVDAEQQYSNRRKTRKQLLLEKMERLIPWSLLLKIIAPHYHQPGKVGRPPYPLEVMLRVLVYQYLYNLSDQSVEESLVDTPVARSFCRIDKINQVPDQNTVMNFRHLLEKDQLQERIFDVVLQHLSARGLVLEKGTIVDGSIIAAPRSTKNQKRQRDPEMSSVGKGKQWYFGMKSHIAVDADSGIVTRHAFTTAKEHDSSQLDKLIGPKTKVLYGDSAYCSKAIVEKLQMRKIKNMIHGKAAKNTSAKERKKIRTRNNKLSKVRCRVEHPFAIIKCRFGFNKLPYKGIFKNAQRIAMLLAMANLCIASRILLQET